MRRENVIAAIVAVALFMEQVDATIIATALPAIAADLGTTPLTLNVAVTAYLLALAIFIPVSGWVADRYGARNVFRLAIVVFLCGSVCCALSNSLYTFVASRILQGVGGAMMTPVARLIILRSVEKSQLITAMSFMAIPGLAGPLFGPPLGGLIVTVATWHWIFLVNIPIGIAAVVAGWFLIPRLPGHATLRNDYVGIGLFGLGILAVVFPIIEGRAYGWPLWAFAMMAAGLALLAAFVLWTRGRAAIGAPQLLNFDLITNRQFMFGAFVITVFASGIPRAALTLAGHTHGGQVRILGWSPRVPSRYGNRYAWGRVQEGGHDLVVSGGLGTTTLPVRFGVPPEITLVEIGA
jgi:MFS family permease